MGTGEGAEELVEDLPNIGKQIIHEHEEIAEKFAIIMYATGLLGLLSLYTSIKNHKLAKTISFITLILALFAAFFAKSVGTTGGEIRHTEIRANSGAIPNENATDIQNEKDED
jgi:formylmethanofuran dehydrogenase subunit A